MIAINPQQSNYLISFEGFEEHELLLIYRLIKEWFNGTVKSFLHKPYSIENIRDEPELIECFNTLYKFQTNIVMPVLNNETHDWIILNDSLYSLFFHIDILDKDNSNTFLKKALGLMKIFNSIPLNLILVKIPENMPLLYRKQLYEIKKMFANTFFIPEHKGKIDENAIFNSLNHNYHYLKIDTLSMVQDFGLVKTF